MKHPLFYLLLASIALLIFSCDEKIKKGIRPTQENQNAPENIDSPKIKKPFQILRKIIQTRPKRKKLNPLRWIRYALK